MESNKEDQPNQEWDMKEKAKTVKVYIDVDIEGRYRKMDQIKEQLATELGFDSFRQLYEQKGFAAFDAVINSAMHIYSINRSIEKYEITENHCRERMSNYKRNEGDLIHESQKKSAKKSELNHIISFVRKKSKALKTWL